MSEKTNTPLENANELRRYIKKSNFDFISPGTYLLKTVYDFVKAEYPDLCDDNLVLPKNKHPVWKNRTQFALADRKGSGYVTKGERNYWIFGQGDAIDPPNPAETMQFPPEVEEIQERLDDDRFEEVEEEEEDSKDLDQRGWVYILWCPAYPQWIVTGKGKTKKRPEGYNTYSPYRDYVVVGMAYVENRREEEKKLQDEIEKEYPGKRGKPSNKPSEWFEVTREQAFEILKRLNPDHTYQIIR